MRDNFLTDIIDADLAAGRHDHVATRFPPEPNGYLHIGHAKSICLNWGLAQRYDGRFHMRFDDTNPVAEEQEYVDSIQADIAWLLGGTADDPPWTQLYFASDYFEQMYAAAVTLVEKGLAYVDSQTAEEIREQRGDFESAGVNSPYRDRSVAENLDLFGRMRAGEFPDGGPVLRARIDMKHPNMLLRDPVLYRIRHVAHHRTGDTWCIYPMYDFAHCLEDANEGITHSICTLEFESNRALYDWVLQGVGGWAPWPRQYEFARLALAYTVMSKRKLLQLVNEGLVDGWDDPRMPTLAGLRRRGVAPAAIRALTDMVGVAKNNSTVDIGKLEYCIRTDLERRCPRAFGVLRPLRLTIKGITAAGELDVPWWPGGVEAGDDAERVGESRKVPTWYDVLIDREDFAEKPGPGYKRLSPGATVRLRHFCVVRCDAVEHDEAGNVSGLVCTPLGADAKAAGTIHWVSAKHAIRAEVRLYDRLFAAENPTGGADVDFKANLNPESLVVVQDAALEPALADAAPGSHWQLERVGYFVRDPVLADRLVFNRTSTLRDAWGRGASRGAPRGATPPASGRDIEKKRDQKTHRDRDYDAERKAGDPALYARYRRHLDAGVGQEVAYTLTGSVALASLYEDAAKTAGDPLLTATWIANVLPAAMAETGTEPDQIDGASVGRLVQLVKAGAITRSAGREVLGEVVSSGRDPATIVQERGLLAVRDEDAIAAAIDEVMGKRPGEAERLLAGEQKLVGFFMGQVMRAMKGKGDPKLVRAALLERAGQGG